MFKFWVEKSKTQGNIAWLTFAVGPDVLDAKGIETERERLEKTMADECTKRGFMIDGDLRFDCQSNLITGGADLTVAAFVWKARRGVSGRGRKLVA